MRKGIRYRYKSIFVKYASWASTFFHYLIRPTKIMQRADKNWAHFQKKVLKFTKHFINQSCYPK